MDRQTSAATGPERPIPPAAARLRARPAGDDVQRACAIAQWVVAIAFGHVAFAQSGPAPERTTPRAAAFARQTAMYLAHVGFGLSMAEIGKAFGRDRTTVVHACHLIEDRRDEACFDELLDHLEQAGVALRAASRINQARLRRTG